MALTQRICLQVRCFGLSVSKFKDGCSSLDSSADWKHCVVFLGKPLHSNSASIHPGVQKQFYQGSQANFEL